jgi:pimeloyl-ACP methyl ester carboxylesterase
MSEQEIYIQGLKINYKIMGLGPVVFILHGWGASADSWIRVGRSIAQQGFRVIIPDLPGFGKSAKPQKVWNLDDYCNFVTSFIDVLGYKKVILIGHSFGGRIAIKLATKNPQRIEKLILVSAAGIRPKKRFKDYVAVFLARASKPFSGLPGFNLVRKLFYKKFLKKTDYFRAKGIMKEVFKKVIREDLEPFLKKIEPKTLIVWGSEDKITPLADGLKMKKEIKGSELTILKGVEHALNLKAPTLLSERILEFIKEE